MCTLPRHRRFAQAAIEGPPDIVVETLSPSKRWRGVDREQQFYASVGVPEYRIVDPERRAVTVLALRGGVCESVMHPGGVAMVRGVPVAAGLVDAGDVRAVRDGVAAE